MEDGGGEGGGGEGGGGEGGGGEGGSGDGKGEVGGGEVEGGGGEGSSEGNPFPNAMTNSPYAKKNSVKAKESIEGYESAARIVRFCNQSKEVGVMVEDSAKAEEEKLNLPVKLTDDEPYAIVPCVRDMGN